MTAAQSAFSRTDGDINQDGVVDFADFRRWKDSFLAAHISVFSDFDSDGDIDGDDFLIWQVGFGVDASGDADNDGDTDGDDFLAWQAQCGSGVAASENAGQVPEPQALILALLACCRVVAARRRA